MTFQSHLHTPMEKRVSTVGQVAPHLEAKVSALAEVMKMYEYRVKLNAFKGKRGLAKIFIYNAALPIVNIYIIRMCRINLIRLGRYEMFDATSYNCFNCFSAGYNSFNCISVWSVSKRIWGLDYQLKGVIRY